MKWWLAVFVGAGVLTAQAPLPELTSAQKADARKQMDAIRKNWLGPYSGIAWYCADGRKLPPKGAPCGPKGGHQHAEPSPGAQRLAALNFDVADFLAAMPFETFFDAPRNHHRLREFILRDYLASRARGWIYAKTYSRRGVMQAEDEEGDGRKLLAQMLAQHEWVQKHYLLAMQVVAAVPHGAQTSRVREIRSLSASLADALPAFQPLRGKIHSRPEQADIGDVEAFIAKYQPKDAAGFAKLVALMKAEYNAGETGAAFDLKGQAERGVALSRQLTSAGLAPAQRLQAADELLQIQEQAFRYASLPSKASTRRARLEEVGAFLRLAAAGGWHSPRQLEALETELRNGLAKQELDAAAYEQLIAYLEGGLEWARATQEMTVGETQAHFAMIEPLAEGLSDDLLRRSILLPLAGRLEALTQDADTLAGHNHRLLDSPSRRGIRALNPGVAIGKLEIIETAESHQEIEPDHIYVIPATVADLKPMRGILTLDSGNALSHAQLLAANLGIPNATVPSSLLPALKAVRGQEIFYAVTPRGTVVLRPWTALTPEEQDTWRKKKVVRARVKLDTSKTNVTERRLRLLEETSMADSGVLCGPKAANLGQLKRLFPKQVAPGVVVPFGVYYAHAERKNAAGVSVAGLVSSAYAESERLRSSGATSEAVRTAMRPRLAEIRKAIAAMTLEPWLMQELSAKLRSTFGPDGSYGVFVRSDTNAEDLPQFTGAGLNLTVPNVVGEAKIAEALKAVWASPFEERAWAWRSEALESSDRVYPSVVLLRTVASDKSGVMATANLSTLELNDLTVNVNEGVAAVVDGGVSESLLLEGSGQVRLLAQARAAYKKVPLPKGGFARVPTSGSDWVLSQDEIGQLRALAKDVKAKLKSARDDRGAELPWDIEFGFEKGELRLFQIRPLVRYREALTLEALASLESEPTPRRALLDRPLEAK
ncbi:MAG: hypothetical protein HY821_00210 [Acidobacteria bacterium]|nr:hypothetical protein [Acidobacteriota bacterium]